MRTANSRTEFIASITAFEAWMQTFLGPLLLVASDLRAKHKLMREDAFLFLRGTCWRWAEIAGAECPELNIGPKVASVGDAHVGNFGLWRDAEGRLVWGVNDYDEAAIIPYRMDLARLVSPEPVHAYAAVFLAEAALFLVGALLALRIEHASATLLRRAARPRRPVLQPRYR